MSVRLVVAILRGKLETLRAERDEARRDASTLEAALTRETALVHELRRELDRRGAGDVMEVCMARARGEGK